MRILLEKKISMPSTPTLCLTMIVKNESDVILSTLERVVSYIDTWVICDTGSTDDTCTKVEQFFQLHDIPGEIFHDEWVHFAHNRTLAFQRARSRADYSWVLDADDLLCGTLTFPHPMNEDAYSLTYGAPRDLRFVRPQIFHHRWAWEYRGVLHELPFRVDGKPYSAPTLPGDYYLDYMHSRTYKTNHRNKNPFKYLDDAHVMEKALRVETDVETYWRYVYYIAQSYFDYGDYEKAYENYQLHAEKVRNSDTCFAHLYAAMSLSKIDKEKHEPKIVEHYLRGYMVDSQRAECLYFLALMYFESQRYEKAHETLRLGKEKSWTSPASGFKVFCTLYEWDLKWLWIQTCHVLGKSKESDKLWSTLPKDLLYEKMDLRLYPRALSFLSPAKISPSQKRKKVYMVSPDPGTLSSLLSMVSDPCSLVVVESVEDIPPSEYVVRTGACPSWLFVRPWNLGDVVDAMEQQDLERMYLCRAETLWTEDDHDHHRVWIEKACSPLPKTTTQVWKVWKDALCTRYPTASYETLWEGDRHPNVVVSLGIQGVGVKDFLSLFFLFSLCHEFGFSFRFSKKPYQRAMPFCGSWKKKSEFRDFLKRQPLWTTGNFFRVDWLPVDYETVAWPALLRFLGCKTMDTYRVDAETPWTDFSERIGARKWILEDPDDSLWGPLVAHLVVLFHVRFSVPSTTGFLRFQGVVDADIQRARFSPVVVVSSPVVQNEILQHTPCLISEGGTDTDLVLHLQKDFALSEPFLTWPLGFMECVWNARYGHRYGEPSWNTLFLAESSSTDFFLSRKNGGGPTASYPFPLFHPLENSLETSLETSDMIFFPRLHFVDAEVYYTSSPLKNIDPYFDGYNQLGFYKKFRSHTYFDMETMEGYAGDWLSSTLLDRRYYLPEKGVKHWPRTPHLVPHNGTAVYTVGKKGLVDPSSCLVDDYFFLGFPGKKEEKQGIMAHLHVWDALLHDKHHEYYVIGNDTLTTTMNTKMTTTRILQQLSVWDIVVLGDAIGKKEEFRILEGYEGENAVAYMIHKKTAAFLLTVLNSCGCFQSLENIWKSHARWLRLYSVVLV